MFGGKRNSIAVVEHEQETIIPLTREVAKSQIVKNASIPIADLEYLAAREKITRAQVTGVSAIAVNKLVQSGYTWFVKSDNIVPKFKYHAQFRAEYSAVWDGLQSVKINGQPAIYSGYVPNWAIKRVMQLDNVVHFQFMTIHSNYPMPVEYLKVADPIVIGWLDNPQIILNGGKIRSMNTVFGLVVAIWDADGREEII